MAEAMVEAMVDAKADAMLAAKAARAIRYGLYYGTFIDTPSFKELRILEDTLVGVGKGGEIDFVEVNISKKLEGQSVLDYVKNTSGGKYNVDEIEVLDISNDGSKFFFPGFVDTHIHASQYPNVGIGFDCQLLDWLKKYTFPLENSFTDNNKQDKLEFARQVYFKIVERTMSGGTTCASYFTTIDTETSVLFAQLLLEHGQRGFVGKVCMNHNDVFNEYEEDMDSCLENMKQLIKAVEGMNPVGEELLKPIVTPRFAPVCSPDLLDSLGQIAAKHGLPIQTHISENKDEIQIVSKCFPHLKNYASVYDDHGLLTSSTVLAHGVYLTQEECHLIKQRNCSISHCPTSNVFIYSGDAPIKKYLHQDSINVSLGTDVSGGYSHSILEVVKQSILTSHHLSIHKKKDDFFDPKLTVSEALFMATQGGATAVGMGNLIGSFDVGKKWDAQLIDLEAKDSPVDLFNHNMTLNSLQNGETDGDFVAIKNLLGKWIFCGDDRNCVKVWCNGRIVVDKLE